MSSQPWHCTISWHCIAAMSELIMSLILMKKLIGSERPAWSCTCMTLVVVNSFITPRLIVSAGANYRLSPAPGIRVVAWCALALTTLGDPGAHQRALEALEMSMTLYDIVSARSRTSTAVLASTMSCASTCMTLCMHIDLGTKFKYRYPSLAESDYVHVQWLECHVQCHDIVHVIRRRVTRYR